MKVLLIAAVPALAAILLWAILDLENFVVFALLGAILVPASLVKPFGTNVDAADVLLLIALAAWLVRNSVRASPDPWVRGGVLGPALAFWAVNLASIAWSVNHRHTIIFAFQLAELVLLFPLVFATIPSSLSKLGRALVLFVVLTTLEALATLIEFGIRPSSAATGTYLPGLNKNALGSFLAAGLVVAYGLWMGQALVTRRVIPFAAMCLDLAGLVASGSRGSMLGAGVAVIIVTLLLGRRRLTALAIVAALATLYIAVVVPGQRQKTSAAGSYSSNVIRSISWSDAVKKIGHKPFLGSGARTYSDTLPPPYAGTIPDPNNLFLLTWAEIGIPGLLALIFLLYRIGRLIVRVRKLPHEAAVMAVAAGGVAISFLVHFEVDISWVRGETTLEFAMIGLVLAIERIVASDAGPVGASRPRGRPTRRQLGPTPDAVEGTRTPLRV